MWDYPDGSHRTALIPWHMLDYLNLPGTPNTSSEYYMECAACANDGFEKKEIKSKTIFIHKFLEFCYFLFFELRNQHDCVEKQEEGIMNGVYIMGNENV